MGASSSIVTNQVFISFNKSCNNELREKCINHINELGYNIINKDYIYEYINKGLSDFSKIDEIKYHILSSKYIIQFVSSESLKCNFQAFIEDICFNNNKNIIYLFQDEELLPIRNSAMKRFINNQPSYPCFDHSSIEYSLQKIKKKLISD